MTDPGERELRDTRRDDPARFLRELRELRSHAGLGHAELAARADLRFVACQFLDLGDSDLLAFLGFARYEGTASLQPGIVERLTLVAALKHERPPLGAFGVCSQHAS